MWCSGRNKVPLYSFNGSHIDDLALMLLLVEKISELLQFAIGSDEICAIIRENVTWFSPATDKSLEGIKESLGG